MDLCLTANAGLLVEFADGNTVLVDALHCRRTRFSPVPPSAAERVLARDAQCFLVTHTHADHYEEDMVRSYLLAHPDCMFLGPTQVRGIPLDQQELIRDNDGTIAFGDIAISFVRLTHEGEEYADVPNYGYTVRAGGESVLVLGDASIAETRRGLTALTNDGPVTVAALDFPVLALARGREALESARAETLVGIHLPFAADDTEGYRKSARRALSRVSMKTGIPAMLLEDEGQCIHIG